MNRKTVNLSDDEAARLARYLDDTTPEAVALAGRVGEEAPTYSESATLRRLALLGMQQIEEDLLVAGYEELARSETDEDRQLGEIMAEVSAKAIDEEIGEW